MKNIVEKQNSVKNVPTMSLDNSIKKYSTQNYFSDKKEDAKDFINKAGLPTSELHTEYKTALVNSGVQIPFQPEQIRKVWNDNEWWFSINDIILFLTESKNPTAYWQNLKSRESVLLNFTNKIKLPSNDKKYRYANCTSFEGAIRINLEIPSPKAETFLIWLAHLPR